MGFGETINASINQNVLVLIVGLVGLYFSKEVKILFYPSLIITIFMLVSVTICMGAYTCHYVRGKFDDFYKLKISKRKKNEKTK